MSIFKKLKNKKRIYIICPIANGTPPEIKSYVKEKEKEGYIVHFPLRDVNQDDPTGINICISHRKAMKKCDEVHIFWDSESKGSHFDLGMAFALNKKWKMIKSYHDDIITKSYHKVILLSSIIR